MRRNGFTLVEVVVAVAILVGVILGMLQLSGTMVHTISTNNRQLLAVELAEDRLSQIRVDPAYAGLEARYIATETGFPGLTGITRTTAITANASPDYKKITVTVSGSGLVSSVQRTTTVAAP